MPASGLAAPQATDKLRAIINEVFRVMAPEVAVRADRILNPAPVLTATEPAALQFIQSVRASAAAMTAGR